MIKFFALTAFRSKIKWRFNLALITVASFIFMAGAVQAADLVRPTPSIAAAEVVAIQLTGLKHNNVGGEDLGIRQTWAFAHPQNRAITGPFPRFAMMMKGPAYAKLLDHKSHDIKPVQKAATGRHENGEMWQKFDVLMETDVGDILHFFWVVQKVAAGQFKDCWMTVGVSAPRPAGVSG